MHEVLRRPKVRLQRVVAHFYAKSLVKIEVKRLNLRETLDGTENNPPTQSGSVSRIAAGARYGQRLAS